MIYKFWIQIMKISSYLLPICSLILLKSELHLGHLSLSKTEMKFHIYTIIQINIIF